MIMIMRGRLMVDYLKAFMAAPEDREPAMQKLAEASGSRLLELYFTAGDADFMMIVETDSPDKMAATSFAVASTGLVTDMTTLPAWTCAEFKAIGGLAGTILTAYLQPGRA